MKIASYVDFEITSGGGFNQSFNAIIQLSKICKDENIKLIVYTNSIKNQKYLIDFNINCKIYKLKFTDKLLSFIYNIHILKYLSNKFNLVSSFEKELILNNVDLVYFIAPTNICLAFQKLNFIYTIWDLCHLDNLEFPEVRINGEFERRDILYNACLIKAFAVICDSKISKQKIINRYRIDEKRIIVMPFSPSPFLKKYHLGNNNNFILSKYQINRRYFFYPAQFWPHKNHVRLIEALKLLIDSGIVVDLVFCGSNKGNLNNIKRLIEEFNLTDNVKILGFVSSEDLFFLYKHSIALVMPTYFGPTNIPPLEAWSIGVPVIYSNICSEQSLNAAILFNPDSAIQLFDSMKKILTTNISKQLIKNGYLQLTKIDIEKRSSENEIRSKLLNFKNIISCYH